MLLKLRFLILNAFVLLDSGNGKFVQDRVKLRMDFDDLSQYTPGRKVMMDGLHYITHFACQIGKCTWEVRVRAVNPARALNRANSNKDYIVDGDKFSPVQQIGIWKYFDDPGQYELPQKVTEAPITMRVILDAEWNEKGLSRSFFTPKVAGKECLGDIKSKLSRQIHVPVDGQWSKWYTGALLQKSRPHHWFFVLEDCQGHWLKEFCDVFGVKPHAYLPNVQFEYELKLLNVDGSHFGFEYWGMPTFTFLTGIIATVGAVFFLVKQIKMKANSRSVHPIIQSVNGALICLIVYLWLHWLHLITFKVDGQGYPKVDALAVFIRSIGNIGLMITIFAVALGFSLNVNEMTIPGEAFLALAVCYGVVELVLSFAQHQTSSFRYHIHASEGVISIIISVFRVLLAAGFVISCESTKNRNDYLNDGVRVFIDKFKWRGMFMMGAQPTIVVWVSVFFAKYQQNRYIEMTCVLAELAAIIYLGFAFLTTKTSFFKASVMGNSLLPMGGGASMNVYRAGRDRID